MLHRVYLAAMLAAFTGPVACAPPRPVAPLKPAYPAVLRSAGVTGTAIATVRVDRTGHASVASQDTATDAVTRTLLAAFAHAVGETQWLPARWFGLTRTDSIAYHVDFVLLRDTLPLGEYEIVNAGNDKRPLECPHPGATRHLVVCAIAERVHYRVLH